MRAGVIIAIALWAPVASAETMASAQTTASADHVITFGAGLTMFSAFPGSYEDPGPALYVDTPLVLGTRHRFFQWSIDAVGIAGYGTFEHHIYVMAGAQAGIDLFLGSVFGLEFKFGLGGMSQIAHRSVFGIAGIGSGGYVFRFWDDDRKRLKLLATMAVGGYFAKDDPMNDAPLAGALGVGLAYEAPL